MTYAKIISETTVDRNPPRRATINGRDVTGELPADYLATLGYLPFDETPMPSVEPTAGKHWEPRYAEAEGRVAQSWTQVDNPAPAPRTFSKLKLYATLAQMGLWDSLATWLNTQTYEGVSAYTAFMLAQELTEDHPMFNRWLAAAKTALDVTDEQAEAILAAAAE